MSSKIEIKIGNLTFSGEGEEKWLSTELDKILEKFGDQIENTNNDKALGDNSLSKDFSQKPLATFLKEKNAESNQNDKFLITSIWLHSKGNQRLKTSDVTKALKDNNQKRLGNPTVCLNQNVSKGNCEKEGSSFYVTEEGKKSVGLN